MNARKKVANGPENHGGNERLQEYTAWDGTGYGRQGREVVGRMVGRARRQTMSVQGSSATSSLSFWGRRTFSQGNHVSEGSSQVRAHATQRSRVITAARLGSLYANCDALTELAPSASESTVGQAASRRLLPRRPRQSRCHRSRDMRKGRCRWRSHLGEITNAETCIFQECGVVETLHYPLRMRHGAKTLT